MADELAWWISVLLAVLCCMCIHLVGADFSTTLSVLQVYTDFISEFLDSFSDMMGDVVTEITVGMGPAGELRYPAYPEGDRRWRFPGVGEFQCYDKYMLSSLRAAANETGEPEWCASTLLRTSAD